jgi:CHAT domain-containing protein
MARETSRDHTLITSMRRWSPDRPQTRPWLSLVGILCLWSLSCLCLCSPVLAVAAASSSPEPLVEQGIRAFQRGAFEQAILRWDEAARQYARLAKPTEHCDVLIRLAQAYQAVGHYTEAVQRLGVALQLAEQAGDQARTATVLGSLGNLYVTTGPPATAEQYLRTGLSLARATGRTGLVAAILNNLGNLFTAQHQYSEAIGAYTESLQLAQQTGNSSLAARALANAARASLRLGHPQTAKVQLDQAVEQLQGVEDSHDKAYSLLTVGLGYRDLRPQLPDAQGLLVRLAATTFTEAARVAESLGDRRAASYAWGYLGQLYEEEQRYEEALQLTRRAVLAAQLVNAPESLYRWQWQTGRLLKALGQRQEAIAAYRRAVSTLQAIRPEMAMGAGHPSSSFRETVGAVYFDLVDLLLQQAASLPAPDQSVSYLREARDTVELLKAAELRDYFRDDCVDVARSRIAKLDIVSQTAVVVYPILLPDRTELLVSLPTGLKRFTVPVDAATLTREVRAFRRTLEKRTTREYLPHAQQLYTWLIRPLEPDLAAATTDSLVFVPDGPLRTVPMAALHDGTQFLITKYAVATTPGLDLTDPRPISRARLKVLELGLTEAVQGFPSLPHVATELQAIQQLYGGTRLLNQEFRVPQMERQLREEQFTIVHIASHGRFESDVANTFLLTFDDKLTMAQLDRAVGLLRFRDEPLELLTLSACETAAGDDRAALGLAGVAIKAGARSALATLWQINDPASSLLIAEFYQQLQDPSVSRAIALQRAQLKLLHDPRYRHPGYWSPFLLINNWL